MGEKSVIVNSGFNLWTLFTVAFVVMKLSNLITWSWLWVLAPIWIPLVMCIVFILIAELVIHVRGGL